MDSNTFQAVIAIVAMIQVVTLAWIGFKAQEAANAAKDAKTTSAAVHQQTIAIANGITSQKDIAIALAAGKVGELVGRDFEAAKHEPRGTDAGGNPVERRVT